MERYLRWGKNWRELDLGIEKKESIINRGLSLINEITKDNNKNILIVSHGALIDHLLGSLVVNLKTGEKLKNTSITKIHYKNNKWHCDLYNCTKHLEIKK